MELREYFKKILLDFLMIQAGINITIGIIGLLNPSQNVISPTAFFMPFVYAFFCTLSSLVTYSSKEISARKMLFRKIIQFILIELTVIFITYSADALADKTMFTAVLVSVFIIYLLVNLVDYFFSKTQADKMNQKLRDINQMKNSD